MSSPIMPDLVRQLKTIGDPSLSPDGSHLAYTLSWIDQEQVERRSRIMMMHLDASQVVEFTQGIKDSAPSFAPDGSTLAFLRADEQGRRQVWHIGATGGEAKRLTDSPGGVIDLAWSPDSRQVVLCADVEPDAHPGSNDAPAGPRVRVVRRIHSRYDTLGWRGDAHFHFLLRT